MNMFIIGAGFTKAVFPNAPLNRSLLSVIATRRDDSGAVALRERYKSDDIEIALTRLDAEIASSQGQGEQPVKDLSDLRRRVEGELAEYFSAFYASKNLLTKSQWLGHLVDMAFTPGDVAVSLNYDCVLEGALDCQAKWSPNEGYGSSLDNPLAGEHAPPKSPVVVLKIHGSSNFVIAPYADKPSAYSVGFVFSECFFPRSAKNTHFGFGAGTGKSYLIAPSYVKIPTVQITYLMLDALAASTEAENLIVIGSALRPEDSFLTVLVTNFLRQPSWRNRKIIVVDPAARAIKDRLESYWGVNVSDQIFAIEGYLENSIDHLLKTISRDADATR